jgi:phosphatidylglycerol---prolipoprotein diacylglyceryl transferase
VTSRSVITINIDPNLHLGPVTLAWHGLTIAIGILVGGLAAARFARERALDLDPLYTIGALLALGGIVGGRLFYGEAQNRTGDTTIFSRVLYRLSYLAA